MFKNKNKIDFDLVVNKNKIDFYLKNKIKLILI